MRGSSMTHRDTVLTISHIGTIRLWLPWIRITMTNVTSEQMHILARIYIRWSTKYGIHFRNWWYTRKQ